MNIFSDWENRDIVVLRKKGVQGARAIVQPV